MRKIAFAMCLVALLVTLLSGCSLTPDNSDKSSVKELWGRGQPLSSSFGSDVEATEAYTFDDCYIDYAAESTLFPRTDVKITLYHGWVNTEEYGNYMIKVQNSEGAYYEEEHTGPYSDEKYKLDASVEDGHLALNYNFSEEFRLTRGLFSEPMGYIDMCIFADYPDQIRDMVAISGAKRLYYKTDGETVELFSQSSFNTDIPVFTETCELSDADAVARYGNVSDYSGESAEIISYGIISFYSDFHLAVALRCPDDKYAIVVYNKNREAVSQLTFKCEGDVSVQIHEHAKTLDAAVYMWDEGIVFHSELSRDSIKELQKIRDVIENGSIRENIDNEFSDVTTCDVYTVSAFKNSRGAYDRITVTRDGNVIEFEF